MILIELYISDIQVDLYESTKIDITMQVNDIADVKDRQTNYTNSFSIPKTPKNVQLMDGLGIFSDTSRIPYQKPACKMKIQGFDFIIKGWLNVKETTDEYKIYVYSGIINFFKAIENKTIGNDLDLSEINHEKDLATVIASQLNPNFRYLLADYGGKTHYGTPTKINIDYLTPSVNFAYLWNKITERFGFTYTGSIFENEHFTNLWFTYPKGITGQVFTPENQQTGSLGFTNSSPYTFAQGNIGVPFIISQSGKFRFSLNGNLAGISNVNLSGNPLRIQIWKPSFMITEFQVFATGDFDYTAFLNLNRNDEIHFYFVYEQPGNYILNLSFDFNTELTSGTSYDFTEELKEFSITNFVKEFLNRFCLTLFPIENSNEIEYLTISERINTDQVIDWSDKYISRDSESYTYASFAQSNSFTFKYNDEESTYANGSIYIDNINLDEEKTAFASVMYAPEKDFTAFQVGSQTLNLPYLKIYNKDISENDGETTITYKGLDKRFIFVKSEPYIGSFIIGSEEAIEDEEVNSFNLAINAGDWKELLSIWYTDMKAILNDSRIHNINLNINAIDLLKLDFRPLYYFNQEQQYYILNKLQSSGKAEFVRINKDTAVVVAPPEPTEVSIIISWMDDSTLPMSGTDSAVQMKILSIIGESEIDTKEWQKLIYNWESLETDETPLITPVELGVTRFRIRAVKNDSQVIYSNELKYTRNEIPVYDCKEFIFQYFGYEEDHVGTVIYIDCFGKQITLNLTHDGSNGGYTIPICASSIVEIYGYVNDVTNYANQNDCGM